ncbi:hypothetical protein FACS1894181_03220 [Bacteroidia bacterium]|nr:hypothetical protein FACS1894181_03220 [Bacteroidia bacterium]
MKHILLLLFPITITACTGNYPVIEGKLPSGAYNNEWVYWVPIKGASAETVDSTLIHGNTFRLIPSKHNQNKTGIIRVKPQLRLSLQEIVVLTEPGTVLVTLDSISSAKGTPLNETLQRWKNKKQEYDNHIRSLYDKYTSTDTTGMQAGIKNASTEYRTYIYRIISENKNNEAGKFLYSLYKSTFTPEQLQALAIPEE